MTTTGGEVNIVLTSCKGCEEIIATEEACKPDAHQGQCYVLGNIRLPAYKRFSERIFHYVAENESKTSPNKDSEDYLICMQ